MQKRIAIMVALVGLAATAAASVPEGQGNLALGIGLEPQQHLADYAGFKTSSYTQDWALSEALQGDFPIWSGISGDLSAAFKQQTIVINNNGNPSHGDGRFYGLGAGLNFYAAAFAGKPFSPCFTVSASYNRSLSRYYNDTWPGDGWYWSYGASEGEGLDAVLYLDLAHGAGADTSRAFVPHFGRVGQCFVDLGWTRTLDHDAYPESNFNGSGPILMGTQTYSLKVGAALTPCLGASLGGTYFSRDQPYDMEQWFGSSTLQNDTRNTWSYSVAASWAFGSVDKREDK